MLNKVPEATIYFWVIKILATPVGETISDYFNTTLNFGLVGTFALMATLSAPPTSTTDSSSLSSTTALAVPSHRTVQGLRDSPIAWLLEVDA